MEALLANQLLVQEVRHRVTNSLQIVAGALLLGALASRSEEARSALHSAHGRIMAVAELERRLRSHATEIVDLHDYLEDLCANLSAAVILDASRVKIAVAAASATVSASTASSLGMIVAELVTNAQKYAFPDGRSGTITVSYETCGPGWLLKVCDDGVGLGEGPIAPGLGNDIVRALSRQLNAAVTVENGGAGVAVSVMSFGSESRPPRRPVGPKARRALRGG